LAALENAGDILFAGAGGGYDVLAALPLYFAARTLGKRAHLANLSTSNLQASSAERLGGTLFRVDRETTSPEAYFPELQVARWLSGTYDDGPPLYAIERSGVVPTAAAYHRLLDAIGGVDLLVLVDGGTDILMRGDEAGLGTPEEDVASLCAVAELNGVARKIVACIGFGVDAFHGVCHVDVLEAMAALTRDGGFCGAISLTSDSEEVAAYVEAVDYISRVQPPLASIVNTSIAAAIRGQFGNHQTVARTKAVQLFINPLMALYWTFDVGSVARRNLYLDRIRGSTSTREVTLAIEHFRSGVEPLPAWRTLPF